MVKCFLIASYQPLKTTQIWREYKWLTLNRIHPHNNNQIPHPYNPYSLNTTLSCICWEASHRYPLWDSVDNTHHTHSSLYNTFNRREVRDDPWDSYSFTSLPSLTASSTPNSKKKLQFWCQDIHFQGLSSQCLMFSSDNLITNSIGSTTFGEWNHWGGIASSFFYVYLSFIPQTHTSTQLGFIFPQSIQFIFLFLLQNYFLFIISSTIIHLTIFTIVITYLNLLHYT